MGLLVFKISVGLLRSVVGSTPIHSRLVFKEEIVKHPKALSIVIYLCVTLLFGACKPGSVETPETETPSTMTKSVSTPGKQPQPNPTTSPSPTATRFQSLDSASLKNLKLQVRHPWFGEAAEAFDAIVADFNSNNEWGIKIESVAGHGLVQLGEQLASEKLEEDLVIAQTYDLLFSVEEQTLVDLTPYAKDPQQGLGGFYADESPFADFSPLRYENEPLFVLPIAYQPALLFYNLGWARTLGLNELPLSREAFTEQMTLAKNARLADSDPNNNGTGGLLLARTTRSAQGWYGSFGGGFVSGSEYLGYDSEALLASYQWLKQGFDQVSHWVGMESTPYDYFARNLALAYEADLDDLAYQAAAMTEQEFDNQWLSLPYPTDDGKGAIALESLGIALKTEDESKTFAAWLFARYLLEPAQQRALVNVHGYWPVIDAPVKVAPDYAAAHPAWASAVMPGVRFSLMPEGENWAITRRIFQDAYLRVYGLDAQYFPRILELLTQTLKDIQAGNND